MNSSAQPSRRIASNLLWTPQGLLRNPLVGVAADGRILSVGTCPEPDRCPGTEFYAGVLAPGLVNAHCHLELSYLLGAIPERCGFAGFAGAMSQVRERFSAEQRVQAVEAADAAMWQAGIEAVGDISNGDTAFAVKSRSRIAYHTFVEFFGLRAASAEHLLPLLRHPQTSLTPHSLYSVQDAPCVRSLPGAMPRFRSISWNLPAKRRSSNTAARCGSGTRRPVSPAISCITAPRPNVSWPACRTTAA